jgi:hypothetical protein
MNKDEPGHGGKRGRGERKRREGKDGKENVHTKMLFRRRGQSGYVQDELAFKQGGIDTNTLQAIERDNATRILR